MGDADVFTGRSWRTISQESPGYEADDFYGFCQVQGFMFNIC